MMFKHLAFSRASRAALGLLLLLLVVAPTFAQSDSPLIDLGSSDALGAFLVDAKGMTLYVFDHDQLDVSNCSAQCAENWPPLIVDSADAITAAEGIPGDLATTERTDGTLQVTYNGWPLYYWLRDKAAGDTLGQAVGKVWWVVPPATVYVGANADLGRFLVGDHGMTVYRFEKDEPGVSNCYDQCAENWPPVTVASEEDLVKGVNMPGELATAERKGGALQVTYNGMPLYYYAKDTARGDANGEEVGDVWHTIPQETVAVSHSDDVGDFLVANNGFTLYTFKNDAEGVSNCADDCAKNWPPFTVNENDRLTAGEGVSGELATIERADGKLQVTYNGMPLYYFGKDAAPGDTNGHKVGDVWFAAAP